MRGVRLAWVHLRVGVLNELQYRINFWVQLLQSLLALAAGIVVLALVFSRTPALNGWSHPELLAVFGVHLMAGGIIGTAIQPNMERLMRDVRMGTLDFALTKPTDSQLLVSVREYRVWQSVDVVIGLGVLVVAAVQLEASIGGADVAAFLAALVLGAFMLYCFWLVLTTGAFWIVRMESIVEMFDGVFQTGRWPVGVYPAWLRASLTFLVPIAFAVTVPAEAFTSRLDGATLAGALGVSTLLGLAARWFWRFGLRHYSGASA
jgi:ABC-2 type transport system permease protein